MPGNLGGVIQARFLETISSNASIWQIRKLKPREVKRSQKFKSHSKVVARSGQESGCPDTIQGSFRRMLKERIEAPTKCRPTWSVLETCIILTRQCISLHSFEEWEWRHPYLLSLPGGVEWLRRSDVRGVLVVTKGFIRRLRTWHHSDSTIVQSPQLHDHMWGQTTQIKSQMWLKGHTAKLPPIAVMRCNRMLCG